MMRLFFLIAVIFANLQLFVINASAQGSLEQISNVKILEASMRLGNNNQALKILDLLIDMPTPCQNSFLPVMVSTNLQRTSSEQIDLLYTAGVTAVSTGANVTFRTTAGFRQTQTRCVAFLTAINNPGSLPHMTVDLGGGRVIQIRLAP